MKFVEFERERFFSRLIWLLPILYVLHIIEEANGFSNWVTNVIGGQISVGGFYRNNAIFMFFAILLCLIKRYKPRPVGGEPIGRGRGLMPRPRMRACKVAEGHLAASLLHIGKKRRGRRGTLELGRYNFGSCQDSQDWMRLGPCIT
jgi:hypothetical protein